MSTHGGSRQGAGRRRGSRDKGKAALQALRAANGETPIQLWARVMADPEAPLELRLMVARDYAPYLHAKPKQELDINAKHTHDAFWTTVERERASLNGHANGKDTSSAS